MRKVKEIKSKIKEVSADSSELEEEIQEQDDQDFQNFISPQSLESSTGISSPTMTPLSASDEPIEDLEEDLPINTEGQEDNQPEATTHLYDTGKALGDEDRAKYVASQRPQDTDMVRLSNQAGIFRQQNTLGDDLRSHGQARTKGQETKYDSIKEVAREVKRRYPWEA